MNNTSILKEIDPNITTK